MVVFRVFTTAAFDRSMKRLAKKNLAMPDMFNDLVEILAADAQNTSRQHNIKKLTDVELGEGQWRIRSGVYRLRYDIRDDIVTLHSITHRKDAYGS
jgi:mRNA-degrading endonuclease RelE of RelBE toxin-antitoxin system